MDISEKALAEHKKLRGKISIKNKSSLDDKEKLSIFYTPGVAAVSSFLHQNPEQARDYTWTNNCVAVVSDGSAVLGLGNIGPIAALPVMEGKAMLFKEFGGIDAVPIVLNVHSADEIVAAVKAIAPSFGGINLEDIGAPICFEVERRLKEELDIPVMHDDQHGTAVVVLAGLINACKITGRNLSDSKIVLIGAGAAGVAISKLIWEYSKANITAVDSKGVIHNGRDDLTSEKNELASFNSTNYQANDLSHALVGADIVIGVSVGGGLTKEQIKTMAKDPIIFAMANPTPEIMPDDAYAAGAAVVATGRSDFPNQVNNVLAFPGIFRGALDNKIKHITEEHKLNAAKALAAILSNPTKDQIIPSVFDKSVVSAISRVII